MLRFVQLLLDPLFVLESLWINVCLFIFIFLYLYEMPWLIYAMLDLLTTNMLAIISVWRSAL